jgi:hypothetical protein
MIKIILIETNGKIIWRGEVGVTILLFELSTPENEFFGQFKSR